MATSFYYAILDDRDEQGRVLVVVGDAATWDDHGIIAGDLRAIQAAAETTIGSMIAPHVFAYWRLNPDELREYLNFLGFAERPELLATLVEGRLPESGIRADIDWTVYHLPARLDRAEAIVRACVETRPMERVQDLTFVEMANTLEGSLDLDYRDADARQLVAQVVWRLVHPEAVTTRTRLVRLPHPSRPDQLVKKIRLAVESLRERGGTVYLAVATGGVIAVHAALEGSGREGRLRLVAGDDDLLPDTLLADDLDPEGAVSFLVERLTGRAEVTW